MTNTGGTPAGWYHAPGDPDGTQRYWDGAQWIGDPQAVPQAPAAPQAPQAPDAPQAPQDADATVAYRPPAADQAPQFGAPPAAGQQPPAFGSPPPGAGAPPPGYTAYGDPGAAVQTGELAEPVQRIIARLVDGIIWIVMGSVIGVFFGVGAIASGSDIGYFSGLLAGLAGLALVLAYEILLTTKTGNTLGKKIFNIKIVNIDGSAVDEQTMFMRMLPYIALSLLGAILPIIGGVLSGLGSLVIGVVSIVFLFTDSMRQAVWDKVAKTKVVAGN